MIDCNKEVAGFHKDEVTLPVSEQENMRERRNSNRVRLNRNLEKQGDPTPYIFHSQGSYRMKTMLKDPKNDYDIDDGAYFHKDDLLGARGGEMDSLQVRQMVCNAMNDGQFSIPPEVKGNCVRIFYKKGYHIDIPIYRKTDDGHLTKYELASKSGWKVSDARLVSDWYERVRKNTSDPKQFRHLNRLLKKFARSRESWKSQTLSGFGITVLLSEVNVLIPNRIDEALYETMCAMQRRLENNTVIYHPVTPNETITSGNPDAKATFFKLCIEKAIAELKPLKLPNCDNETAMKCWDKVFDSTYFRGCTVNENRNNLTGTIGGVTSATIITETADAARSISDVGRGMYA